MKAIRENATLLDPRWSGIHSDNQEQYRTGDTLIVAVIVKRSQKPNKIFWKEDEATSPELIPPRE
jgi:hypothetical protein